MYKYFSMSKQKSDTFDNDIVILVLKLLHQLSVYD